MAFGDVTWFHLAGGSTTTSTAGAHDIYGGTYTGLSNLNASAAVKLVVASSNSGFRLAPSGTGAQPTIFPSFVVVSSAVGHLELPVLQVHDASQIKVIRHSAENPVIFWNLWLRRSS